VLAHDLAHVVLAAEQAPWFCGSSWHQLTSSSCGMARWSRAAPAAGTVELLDAHDRHVLQVLGVAPVAQLVIHLAAAEHHARDGIGIDGVGLAITV